jgi:hypothetical protein
MSFSFNNRKVASEVLAALPEQVARAKQTSPAEEYPMIEAAAQLVHFHVDGVDDNHLVEVNVSGSSTPSTGAKYFNFSCTTSRIRDIASTGPAATPWTPDQGPLVIKPTTPLVDTAGPNADTPIVQPDTPSGTASSGAASGDSPTS